MKEFRIKMSEAAYEAAQKGLELRALNIGVYNRLMDLENTRYEVCLTGSAYGQYSRPMTLEEVIDYISWIKPERYKDCMVLARFSDQDVDRYKRTDIDERELFHVTADGELAPCIVTGDCTWYENDVHITSDEVWALSRELQAALDKAREEVRKWNA